MLNYYDFIFCLCSDYLDDDLLSSFLSDVSNQEVSRVEEKQALLREQQLTEKYSNQDLGTPAEQHARLTCKNYFWKNLNPYEVLQLGTDATVEDIKYR